MNVMRDIFGLEKEKIRKELLKVSYRFFYR